MSRLIVEAFPLKKMSDKAGFSRITRQTLDVAAPSGSPLRRENDEADYTTSLVRQRREGSGRILLLDLPELENHSYHDAP